MVGRIIVVAVLAGFLTISGVTACLAAESGPSAPEVLDAQAACRLARQDKIEPGKIYAIKGIYRSDGVNIASLGLPECDKIMLPTGAATTVWARYQSAFDEKCGRHLTGGSYGGVFTGTFVPRKMKLSGYVIRVNDFVVSEVQTTELDIAAITCPKWLEQ
jgi:hypothetical protein